jgi:hypothetical protein
MTPRFPTDLFPVVKADMVACVKRELALRKRVYPRHVASGMMTQARADREIEVMQGVLRIIERLPPHA